MDSAPKYSNSVVNAVNGGHSVDPPSGLGTGVGVGLLEIKEELNI